mmetsp:Transcript_3227/g.11688  ORF Transcript_3227/g.11688 Transcript_3227/m.11688 type:complete len:711 (+) Transcript_3227:175-2307(+)
MRRHGLGMLRVFLRQGKALRESAPVWEGATSCHPPTGLAKGIGALSGVHHTAWRASLRTGSDGGVGAASSLRETLRQLRTSVHAHPAGFVAQTSRKQTLRSLSMVPAARQGGISEGGRLVSQALVLAGLRMDRRSLALMFPAGILLVPSAVVHMLSRSRASDHVGLVDSAESSQSDLFDTSGGLLFKAKLFARAALLAVLFTPAMLLGLVAMQFKQAWVRQQFAILLHKTLEVAGPAFIKWGQWAAARPDIFPADLCDQLKKLHENAPSHDFVYTRRTVERAFGMPLDSVFLEFDPEPLGCGAVGQVHKAVLRPEVAEAIPEGVIPRQPGESLTVAVKVRHPSVRELINLDFKIMVAVARQVGKLSYFNWLPVEDTIKQFRTQLSAQVDFLHEARQLTRFRHNFRFWPNVTFPRPVYPWVSESVLVEEYVNGRSIAHYIEERERSLFETTKQTATSPVATTALESAQATGGIASAASPDEVTSPLCRSLAQVGLNIILKMFLVDNFVHADLHPGNIYVRAEPQEPSWWLMKQIYWLFPSLAKTPQVVLIDAGMTNELTQKDSRGLLSFFQALNNMDGAGAAQAMLQLARPVSEETGQAFTQELADLFNRAKASFSMDPLHDDYYNMGRGMKDSLDVLRKHRVSIESSVCSMIVTAITLEHMMWQLDPMLQVMDALDGVLRRLDLAQAFPAIAGIAERCVGIFGFKAFGSA